MADMRDFGIGESGPGNDAIVGAERLEGAEQRVHRRIPGLVRGEMGELIGPGDVARGIRCWGRCVCSRSLSASGLSVSMPSASSPIALEPRACARPRRRSRRKECAASLPLAGDDQRLFPSQRSALWPSKYRHAFAAQACRGSAPRLRGRPSAAGARRLRPTSPPTPSRWNACAISVPIGPPPMITSRSGAVSRSARADPTSFRWSARLLRAGPAGRERPVRRPQR